MSSLQAVDVLALDNDQGSQFLLQSMMGVKPVKIVKFAKVWMRREDVCRAWRSQTKSRVVKRREKRKKRDGLP